MATFGGLPRIWLPRRPSLPIFISNMPARLCTMIRSAPALVRAN